ncbi:IS110 family transposase [Candidatus Desantisbacteria bacterium CG_4_10_14_0_8_um_filter_48_22]|uniref:IS110 family transposase n=1 Tax=Candidatus Desantisbacteria bacterium CG_4_10_14_0_8_um_filter_48_22 TaxID=1974543 RepID=A0A2M7SCH4_9BACT|nr:MAG: IS110 family transposase [Candidatus Desantisbacteria bacterium CG_4_10_14_0_8_um_filter_48_22]
MSNKLYVGVDVHSEDNTACFLNEEGSMLSKTFSFPNSLPGAKLLEERIVQTGEENKLNEIKIATEATSFLDLHLVDFLATSKVLAKYSLGVYQLNPKITHGFKKVYPDKDKTDPDDAFVAADRLRFGHLPQPYQEHEPYMVLQRLTRYRFHLVETITQEKNRFLTHLFLKFSRFEVIKPFSNSFSATSKELISQFYDVDELACAPMEELVSFILKYGKSRFPNPEEVVDKLKQVARESYRIRPALARSINLILALSLQTIRALEKNLREIDKAISEEFKGFPNTLISIRGIGPVYAAGIFAETGNINRFHNQAELAKFAGITWRKTKSANFEAQNTRMTKTGNQYLRYYLIQAANSLRVHNEEYKLFYQRKHDEATKHHHKRAVVLTARKLVRLVFSLLKNNCLYQERVEKGSV